jgi:hypothetical protein
VGADGVVDVYGSGDRDFVEVVGGEKEAECSFWASQLSLESVCRAKRLVTSEDFS